MRHHLFLALSDPAPEREAEFHDWYDRHHLQDVVDFCPGFARGRRYWRGDVQPADGGLKWQSLAIYDLEADDVAALHANVSANVGRFTPSNGVFAPDHAAWVYTPVDGGAIPALPQGGDSGRAILLAFFDSAPAVDPHAQRQTGIVMERHPDQRRGESPSWRYLIIRDVPAGDAGREAGRIAEEEQPAALWIYHARGRLHVTNPEAAG